MTVREWIGVLAVAGMALGFVERCFGLVERGALMIVRVRALWRVDRSMTGSYTARAQDSFPVARHGRITDPEYPRPEDYEPSSPD